MSKDFIPDLKYISIFFPFPIYNLSVDLYLIEWFPLIMKSISSPRIILPWLSFIKPFSYIVSFPKYNTIKFDDSHLLLLILK